MRGGYAPGEVEGRVRSDHGNDNRKCDQTVIVGTGEGWLTELSADALRAVLTLSPDAVSE